MNKWTLLLISLFFCTWTLAEEAKPNFLLIFTDDHGWADLGVQGVFDDVKTPNIDMLAREGVRMTNGYVTAPQCVPSRGGLMTGMYQNRFGLESNNAAKEGGLEGFNKAQTIGERLKTAGYATLMTGKWHLGPGQEIIDHGFDHVYYRNSNGPATANIDFDGKDVKLGSYPSKTYHLDACSQVTSAFIERYKDQPFFAYVAYRAPHVPLDPPQVYVDRHKGDMPERRRKALAMISAVDDGVGAIYKTLRKHKLEKNTLIFIIGDNGAPLKIHKLDAPGIGAGWDGSLNDPMNGEKGMVSEGGVRVPFVVHWKGRIPGGQVYDHPVISLDVAATANALAGLPHDPVLDGVNLVPYLSGKKGAPHEALFWRWTNQAAIRKGKWKYMTADNREYLYDMETGFTETQNLLKMHPELAKQMRKELASWTNTLDPKGLDAYPASRATIEYFNWYIDGKRDKPTPAVDIKSADDRQGPRATPVPADQLFERRDKNKDGKVTFEEFLNRRTNNVEVLRKNFNRRDLDGDGDWEKSEIK